MLMSYAASETYALVNSLVGAAATYVAVKATDAAISATNPEFQLTNGYIESFDVVNADEDAASVAALTSTLFAACAILATLSRADVSSFPSGCHPWP